MNIHKDVLLSAITYYKIGGKVDTLIEVTSPAEVHEASAYIHKQQLSPVHILGLGSNALFTDSDIPGVILWVKPGAHNVHLRGENILTAFAGASMDEIIQFSFQHNLRGLGWAGGLPSTVGGAIRGNAGAFGTEIKQSVKDVAVLHLRENTIEHFDIAACHFGYRESFFKQHADLFIVEVTLQLEKATAEQLHEEKKLYQEHILYRQTHHPLEYPSCGSVFKNIVNAEEKEKILRVWPDITERVKEKWYGKVSMAYVIGRLGFSGYTLGDAKVSEKHNNYISNLGHAKANDVQSIIQEIQEKCFATFGFSPQLEMEMVKY